MSNALVMATARAYRRVAPNGRARPQERSDFDLVDDQEYFDEMLNFTTIRSAAGGSVEARDGETLVGHIDFVTVTAGVYDINHTLVFPEFEGQGYGRQLVRAAVEAARRDNARLKASCPYARKLLDRTPEYQDVAVPN